MSVTISTKVPEELAERIEEAREEGETRSATVRRLIRAGLETPDSPTNPVPLVLMWGGSVAVAAQYASATDPFGPLGIAAIVAGYLLTYQSVNDRVRRVFGTSTDSEE
jgi:hypothetical protein